MAQNTFNLTDEQLAVVHEALIGLFPIPKVEVPNEDPQADEDPQAEPVFQDAYAADLHPEMCVKNWLEQQVNRWNEVKAKKAAQADSFKIELNQ